MSSGDLIEGGGRDLGRGNGHAKISNPYQAALQGPRSSLNPKNLGMSEIVQQREQRTRPRHGHEDLERIEYLGLPELLRSSRPKKKKQGPPSPPSSTSESPPARSSTSPKRRTYDLSVASLKAAQAKFGTFTGMRGTPTPYLPSAGAREALERQRALDRSLAEAALRKHPKEEAESINRSPPQTHRAEEVNIGMGEERGPGVLMRRDRFKGGGELKQLEKVGLGHSNPKP